ncbi:MAG: membrane protein insertase YidC [Candidatus Omnitrophota bacterium]
MEKRLFLAIILSILVLMLYSSIVPKTSPPLQESPVQEQGTLPPLSGAKIVEQPTGIKQIVAQPKATNIQPEILQNNDLFISVTPIGTSIKECEIINYKSKLQQTDTGLLLDWQEAVFTIQAITDGISMGYIDEHGGFEIKKEYRFSKDRYIVEMDIEFISLSETSGYIQYAVNIGSISNDSIKKNPLDQRYIECSVALPNRIARGNFQRFNPMTLDGEIQWAGIRDRYFCVVVKPLQGVGAMEKIKNDTGISYILNVPRFQISPGEKITHRYLVYLGPQKPDLLAKLGDNAESLINFGMLDSLSHILLSALKLLYNLSKNWGVAIILFSLLVFVMLSPLSIKSFRSMKKMQELQPLVEALKAKYKDSPQKMNKEVMELYRDKKINPLGGCLPMFLQMPIFIALYQTLMRFIDLKGASFLWIKDLSEPDRLFMLPSSFPVIGNEFNLLPLIMIVTMLLQQKLTSGKQAQSGDTAKQQKMMSLFMSVFFGVIFYHMPSGLVLYWTVNSIVMLVFQVKIIGRTSN